MRASAPGKLMLCGEYAVLHGGPAVVMAVDRRAVAEPRNGQRAGLVEALLEVAPSADHAEAVRDTVADSSALCNGSVKLGLGSSAAVMVAVAARAIAVVEARSSVAAVLDWARRGHATLQGRRGAAGSGVDVIASAVGGLVAADASGAYRALRLPDALCISTFWTGQAADTVSLIKGVDTMRAASARDHDARMSALAASAEALIAACERPDATAAVAAIGQGRDALSALGRAAKLPLELDLHRELDALAAEFGGAAKPTGAGGGDVAIAVFGRAADQQAFESAARARGHVPLGLALETTGADCQFR